MVRHAVGFFSSLLLGFVGGAACGAAILSFGDLIGKSGTTGTEYVGYWDISAIWLGYVYGGLLGAIAAPIAYVTLVWKIGIRRALVPAIIGTLGGGILGAFTGPPFAILAGVGGFFVAIGWAVVLRKEERHQL